MNVSLEGRVAFISGAGHGIGRATARAMARLGATVGVNDLKAEFVEDAEPRFVAAPLPRLACPLLLSL